MNSFFSLLSYWEFKLGLHFILPLMLQFELTQVVAIVFLSLYTGVLITFSPAVVRLYECMLHVTEKALCGEGGNTGYAAEQNILTNPKRGCL